MVLIKNLISNLLDRIRPDQIEPFVNTIITYDILVSHSERK